MTAPTIFNNVLWHCIAEGDSVYYQGLYSLMDAEPRLSAWNKFPKNHDKISAYDDDRSIKTLKWFSNNYYNIIHREDGKLQFNDLRFGIFGEKAVGENDYIFHFILEEEDGKIDAHQSREQPEMEEAFGQLWRRIKGLPMKE